VRNHLCTTRTVRPPQQNQKCDALRVDQANLSTGVKEAATLKVRLHSIPEHKLERQKDANGKTKHVANFDLETSLNSAGTLTFKLKHAGVLYDEESIEINWTDGQACGDNKPEGRNNPGDRDNFKTAMEDASRNRDETIAEMDELAGKLAETLADEKGLGNSLPDEDHTWNEPGGEDDSIDEEGTYNPDEDDIGDDIIEEYTGVAIVPTKPVLGSHGLAEDSKRPTAGTPAHHATKIPYVRRSDYDDDGGDVPSRDIDSIVHHATHATSHSSNGPSDPTNRSSWGPSKQKSSDPTSYGSSFPWKPETYGNLEMQRSAPEGGDEPIEQEDDDNSEADTMINGSMAALGLGQTLRDEFTLMVSKMILSRLSGIPRLDTSRHFEFRKNSARLLRAYSLMMKDYASQAHQQRAWMFFRQHRRSVSTPSCTNSD
jgi:hypothetical protein